MDVFDLVAKLRLDRSEYENGLDDAERKANGFGGKLSKALGGVGTVAKGLGKVGMAVGTAAVSGVATATTAFAKLGQEAVSAYANFEQLSGGVETLFGTQGMTISEYARSTGKTLDEVRTEYALLEKAQNDVMKNADKAYMTAGLSANDYLETVTSFSASLISSLDGDTVKAASIADQAIIDMSDNANKMGTSIDMIQNAYNGFAKQNYTMLDNLKLGYGGTKEEMQRLLEDAEKISGIKYDISNFADISEAIHVIQEEMGIAGATEAEAMGTIQGSIGMMQSAWENFVAGMANPDADIGVLTDNLVTSVVAVADNLVPVITEMVPRLAEGLMQVANSLAPYIPELFTQISTLLVQNLPMIIDTGLQIVTSLADGILQALPALVEQLPALIDSILTFIIDNLPMLIDIGIQILLAVATGLIQAIPQLIAKIPEIIWSIVSGFGKHLPEMAEVGGNLIKGLWQGIQGAWGWLSENIANIGKKIANGFKKVFGIHSPSKVFAEIGSFCVEGFNNSLEEITDQKNLENKVQDAIDSVSYAKNEIAVSSVLDSNSVKTNSRGSENDSMYETLYNAFCAALSTVGIKVDVIPDETGIFKSVVASNNIYKNMHGKGALA